jgi:flavorubredoxin
MSATKIAEDLYWVGAVDRERAEFEALFPLPQGTSYNAYLLKAGEQTALVDTVDPAFSGELLRALDELGVSSLDYVIVQHAEQDHSGSLPAVLARYPAARIVASPRCRRMLAELLPVAEDRIQAVDHDATLALGHRTLRFVHLPWAHWPETMTTYLVEDRCLFSCDLLGAHLPPVPLVSACTPEFLEAAKVYFACIMAPVRERLAKQFGRVAALDLGLVLPSHGPVISDPERIVDSYREWLTAPPENSVLIAYASMHDSTRRLVERLAERLRAHQVAVELAALTPIDESRLATSLLRAQTVVFASPTVVDGAHPRVAYAAYLVNALVPRLRCAAIVGSYGWQASMEPSLRQLTRDLKVEWLSPVLSKGAPGAAELLAIDQLAADIAERHARARVS